MSRKLCSLAVVPALLILLTAGAVQARPLIVQAPPAGLLTQVWQGLGLSWAGVWIKEGPGMDPNGGQAHRPSLPPPAREDHPGQGPGRR